MAIIKIVQVQVAHYVRQVVLSVKMNYIVQNALPIKSFRMDSAQQIVQEDTL
jgi:hypothetical protein